MLPVEGWNDAKKSTPRQLWGGSLSATEIGERLGFSKNSVCGMARRLGISTARHVGPDAEKRKASRDLYNQKRRAERAANRPSRQGVGHQVQRINRGAPVFRIEDFTPQSAADVVPLRKTILEIGKDECRWPYDAMAAEIYRHGLSTVFCCHPVVVGSYCGAHARLTYRAPEPRKVAA